MENIVMKRILAFTLSLAMIVTFIPIFGGVAYGEENEEITDEPIVNEEVLEDDTEQMDEEEAVDESGEGEIEQPAEEPEQPKQEEPAEKKSVEKKVLTTEPAKTMETKEELEEAQEVVPGEALSSFTLKMKNPKKVMHVEAKFTQPMYRVGVFIDGSDNYVKMWESVSSISADIDMSNYSTCAVHKVTLLYIFDSKATKYSYSEKNIKMSMYAKPSYKGSLQIYHNRIEYFVPTDANLINYKLYMDYSANGGKTWKTYGPMNYVQTYSIKVKPNTKYKLRIYYGYNGYKGKDTGNMKYIGTYRTGVKNKVAVKSIKVKAYKVKKKKQKVYGYYTGLYLGKRTYYKYKMKIVVKLKKKPGTYIWINGKRFKGNKKTYTVNLGTCTSYSKPKGKKFTVAMYTYRSKSWGGYSPMYKKSVKVK